VVPANFATAPKVVLTASRARMMRRWPSTVLGLMPIAPATSFVHRSDPSRVRIRTSFEVRIRRSRVETDGPGPGLAALRAAFVVVFIFWLGLAWAAAPGRRLSVFYFFQPRMKTRDQSGNLGFGRPEEIPLGSRGWVVLMVIISSYHAVSWRD
jgi:hypothetical protein